MLDLSQTRDARIDARLRDEALAWFSSVRLDGRPHLVPVWFLWDGATLLIFSKPDQKVRNLRQNPRVMLALGRGPEASAVILIEGEATLLEGGTANPALPAYAEKYASRMASMGWTPEVMAQSYTQAIRVTPTKFLLS